MIKALLYKEWLKTSKIVAVALMVMAATVGYFFLLQFQNMRMSGVVLFMVDAMLFGVKIPTIVTYVPLILGFVISLAQFIPEMTDNRIKQTLHLPMNEVKITSIMLIYGVAIMTTFMFVSMASVYCGLLSVWPSYFIWQALASMLPSLLAGVEAYVLTSWIVLEPSWRQRVIYSFVSLALLSLYLVDSNGGFGVYMLPLLAVILLVSLVFPFSSVQRYKDGVR